MKRIKYICYYDRTDSPIKRRYILSANNKIDYIIKAFNRLNISVDLISFVQCAENRPIISHKQVNNFDDNTLLTFTSFGPYNSRLIRVFSKIIIRLQFIFWFLSNVKKNEEIVVYHALSYSKLLVILKKIKKCKYIGEIEEIYQNAQKLNRHLSRSEYCFISNCDKYIFPTQLLNSELNHRSKPYIIIHGIYKSEDKRNVFFDDNKTHVVYAGTLDPRKGGATAAIEAAEFLPNNYYVHILGTGTSDEISNILNIINCIKNNSKDSAEVSYDGVLRGEAFIVFLQKCQIGLSTQNPDAKFNATSFPSKILTYMANGLEVVSIRIPAIENSAIGKYMHYYDKQDPKEIAKAIKKVNFETLLGSKEVLDELDSKFVHELSRLLYES